MSLSRLHSARLGSLSGSNFEDFGDWDLSYTCGQNQQQLQPRQLFADRVQTSIVNLQLLHDKLVEKSEGSQECVTAESRGEEGGESEYLGGKRSASSVDVEDLLSSLQTLLSVLKRHEASEERLRAKIQVLRERKQALHEEKQQYKRQRGSKCRSQAWLQTERN